MSTAHRVHLGEPFPFPACGYLGPDIAPEDHLPVIHVTADRSEVTCPECLDPTSAAERAGDVIVLRMERLGAVPERQERCGYTSISGVRCIGTVEDDGLCTTHLAGFRRLLADVFGDRS